MERLAGTIHPHPASAGIVKRLGDAYNRSRLTPAASCRLGRYSGWLR